MIPIPPGIRNVTDIVLDTVLELAKGSSIDQMALNVARNRIPTGLPREVFDTLVHIIAKAKPIAQNAPAVAAHMIEHYTQGASSALAQGVAQLAVAHPALHAHLANLPRPNRTLPSLPPTA